MTNKFRTALVSGAAVAALAAFGLPLVASENIDYDGINKIKQQGLNPDNSKVMEIMSYLTDVYGPRLTGSPNVQKAGDWTVAKMKEWGLVNTALEPWTACPPDAGGARRSAAAPGVAAAVAAAANPPSCSFPRGWANEKFYLQAVSPQQFPIPGTPTGWTPGTNGLVRGEVVLVTETTQEELTAKYGGGKLRGKWVISADAPDVAAYWNPLSERYTKEQLERMDSPEHPAEFGVTPPGGRGGGRGAPAAPAGPGRGGAAGHRHAVQSRRRGCKSEGVIGTLSTAPRGHGIYTIGGSSATNPDTGLTAIVIPAEQYGRIARILDEGHAGHDRSGHQEHLHAQPADVQRRRRDSRHGQGRRDRDARRALRFVARVDGRDRQRRGLGRDARGDAHPQAVGRAAAAHRADRALDR